MLAGCLDVRLTVRHAGEYAGDQVSGDDMAQGSPIWLAGFDAWRLSGQAVRVS
jgi:hypothetical protein